MPTEMNIKADLSRDSLSQFKRRLIKAGPQGVKSHSM